MARYFIKITPYCYSNFELLILYNTVRTVFNVIIYFQPLFAYIYFIDYSITLYFNWTYIFSCIIFIHFRTSFFLTRLYTVYCAGPAYVFTVNFIFYSYYYYGFSWGDTK